VRDHRTARPETPGGTVSPMSQSLPGRRPIAGRVSAAPFAPIIALLLVVVLPAPVFAWSSYHFSSTEEHRLLTLMNNFRAANGLAPLVEDSTVDGIARTRSKDLYDKNYFEHDGPDPGTAADAFEDLDAIGYCYTAAGENIAWNDWPDDRTTQTAFNGWVNSPPHRSIMLGNYTRVGLGVFKGDGRWNGDGTYDVDTTADPVKVFTAVFTVPCHSATPTPRPTPSRTARPPATPTVPPKATPQPTATPNSAVYEGPFDAAGDFAGNPHNWRGGGERSQANPAPSPGPPTPPAATTAPSGGSDGSGGYQVVEPLPAVNLLDAILGGIAHALFGS